MGKIDATAEPVRLVDIRPGDSWLKVGSSFAAIVSLATFGFIYFQAILGQSLQPDSIRYLPWILIFAASNAFVEEMLTRFGVVVALYGFIPNRWIPVVSALVFGIPHFFGVPGGILGSIMAGFLGWLLCKSILETRGVFWAWSIHFLQDVIIFAGLFILNL